MSSGSRRKRLSDLAYETAQKRAKADRQTASISDAGWNLLDTQHDSLFLHERIEQLLPGATLKLRKGASAAEIFKTFITADAIDAAVARLSRDYPSWFIYAKSKGTTRRLQMDSKDVYKALALRVWLHGPGRARCTGRSRTKSLHAA